MYFKKPVAYLLVASLVNSSCVHQNSTKPSAAEKAPEAPIQKMSRIPTAEEETPWTDWYKKRTKSAGLLVLSKIRENLLDNNLQDPHVNLQYMGLTGVQCQEPQVLYRTADGTCNDLAHPYVGAANVAFGRNISPKFIVPDAVKNLEKMTPNPKLVSEEFFTRTEFKPVPFLNVLAAAWIQFMNHDWMSHGRNMDSNPYVIKATDGSEILVDRTKENENDPKIYKKEFGKVSKNTVTHWWDASQVYGSSQEEQNELRTFENGLMKTEKVGSRELLPHRNNFNTRDNKQNQGVEMSGFTDNWWLGLSLLHTLFVKEHNAIAKELMKKHVTKRGDKFEWKHEWYVRKEKELHDPDRSIYNSHNTYKEKQVLLLTKEELDEKIFQTSRLVVSAILAKIHTVEWTPAVLPNETLKKGMFINWYGLINPQTWSRFLKHLPGFQRTDWNDANDSGYLVGGIVGSKANNYGVPFSITEEFTSVYRLHSLLPENLNLRTLSQKKNVSKVPFIDTRNEKSYDYMKSYDLKDLYYSLGTQNPGQLVLNNFPNFMQNLEIPGYANMDMGMMDIVRDRERGVPRYNQFRRGINLKPIKSYADFFPEPKQLTEKQKQVVEKFRKVYGLNPDGSDNVESIDLLVGTLAEEVRPDNFGFGETLFQIFILMASRRLMADRFFTDYYKAQYYTETGIKWVDEQSTMSQVIIRHMPELAPHLKGVETAFNPWRN